MGALLNLIGAKDVTYVRVARIVARKEAAASRVRCWPMRAGNRNVGGAFSSETHVKRGDRIVHGDKELVEKLGRNDPCPCGSGTQVSRSAARHRTGFIERDHYTR